MKRFFAPSLALLSLAALSTACGGGKGGAAGAPAANGKPLDIPRCPADAMLDDGEDGNNKVLEQGGRGGYWYTAADSDGTTVTPQAGAMGGTFVMTQGGANGSGYAACMKGKIAEGGAAPFAVVGFNFIDPKDAWDASKFGGIAFWAKKAPGTHEKVRLKLPDANTDPQGGVCEKCFNDFGADLVLTDGWVEYAVMWPEAKQMPDWGNPRPPAITPDKLYGVQWQVNRRMADYDICVDDIAFVGCAQ